MLNGKQQEKSWRTAMKNRKIELDIFEEKMYLITYLISYQLPINNQPRSLEWAWKNWFSGEQITNWEQDRLLYLKSKLKGEEMRKSGDIGREIEASRWGRKRETGWPTEAGCCSWGPVCRRHLTDIRTVRKKLPRKMRRKKWNEGVVGARVGSSARVCRVVVCRGQPGAFC